MSAVTHDDDDENHCPLRLLLVIDEGHQRKRQRARMACHAPGAREGRISADALADNQRAPVKMYIMHKIKKKQNKNLKLFVEVPRCYSG